MIWITACRRTPSASSYCQSYSSIFSRAAKVTYAWGLPHSPCKSNLVRVIPRDWDIAFCA